MSRQRILVFSSAPTCPSSASPGAVAAGVVDDLELVHVEVAERVGGLARARAPERALEPRLELATVHQPGEDVVARVIGQLAVQLAALAHVVEHEHAARHRARSVADRRGGALDVHLVAVALDEQRRPHGLDRAAAADGHRQLVLERLAGFLVEAAEDVVDVLALRLLEAPPGQVLCNRVEVLDGQVLVGGDHAVADRLQRDLRAFLLLEERVLVELALGDVGLDAHQAPQPPGAVRARLGAADHPAPVAVAVAHAVHALEDRRLARDVVADHHLHARHFVRVHQAAPVGRHVRIVLVEAEHLAPAGREVDGVVLDVEVPQPVVGRWQRQRVAFLEPGDVARDAQALEASGEARADELEQQVQVRVPAVAWLRRAERHETVHAAVQRQPANQQRAHAELGEARGVDGEIASRGQRVAHLQDAQVAERAGEVRQPLDRVALHHLRVEWGEEPGGAGYPLDGLLLGIEERDADRVGAGCFAQRLEVALDAVVTGFAGQRLEIDGDLGGEDIESDCGAAAIPEDVLRGEEVGAVLRVAHVGFGTGHRDVSVPLSYQSSLSALLTVRRTWPAVQSASATSACAAF